MELLDSACFLGLSPSERLEQLYLAVGGTDPCFLGNSRVDQLRLIAEVLGLDGCIYSESDFYRLWLLSLDPTACTGLTLQALQGAVYASLYAQAGDDSLVSPECFYGLSPDQRQQALFAAAGGGPIPPPILPAPENLVATPEGTYYSATWGAVTGAAGYKVQLGSGPIIDVGIALEYEARGYIGDHTLHVWAYDENDVDGEEATDEITLGVDPTVYSALVKRFYNADDLGLGAVSAWPDRLAIGPTLVQATSGKRPVNTAASYDGRPAVLMDGIDDMLTATDAGMPTGDMTFLALVKCTTASFGSAEFGVVSHYGTEAVGQSMDIEFGAGAPGVSETSVGFHYYGQSEGIASSVGHWIVVAIQHTAAGNWKITTKSQFSTVSTVLMDFNSTPVLGGTFVLGAFGAGLEPLYVNHFKGYIRHYIAIAERLSDVDLEALADEMLYEAKAPTTLYVETTGNDGTAERGNDALPFATLTGAIGKWLPDDTLQLGLGSFTAPSRALYQSHMTLLGSGRPAVDSESAPTQLVGGTIIRGPVWFTSRDYVRLGDLGADCGSVVCTADFAGVEQQAILLNASETNSPSPAKKGCVVNNVIGLCKATNSPVHGALFENMVLARISNIYTYYGFAGVIFKLTNCAVNNLHAHLHSQGAIYIKANEYAQCADFTIGGTNTITGGFGGLLFVSGEDAGFDVSGVTVQHLTITDCEHPVYQLLPGTTTGCTIDVIIDGASGDGVRLTNVDDFTVSGTIENCAGDGVSIEAGAENVHLLDLVVNDNGAYGVDNASTTATGNGEVTGSGNALGLVGGNPLL